MKLAQPIWIEAQETEKNTLVGSSQFKLGASNIIMMLNLVFVIAIVITIKNNHFRILEEEKFLTNAFGEKYRSYCTKVGRYGPKLKTSLVAHAEWLLKY